jgi:hypothetical protein
MPNQVLHLTAAAPGDSSRQALSAAAAGELCRSTLGLPVMIEAEWLDCTDPAKMLAYLTSRASERKLRLFAVACARRVSHLLRKERTRRVIEASERYADSFTRRR